jgi:dTDP-3-amino-3,4,6-trideoxy-alpha-D-glucose transaminase
VLNLDNHDARASVPFCDLRAAYAADAESVEDALLRVARSGRYVLGAEVEAFEAEFASRCEVRHAVGVGSGTDALALILRAAGIGPRDEVIVPAYTAAATWMAVAWVGATPIGVDTDRATGLIDAERAAAAVGPATRAVVAVHLFGRLAPMAELRWLTDRHGLLLIEDAAHAHATDEGNRPAGSHGDAAAFSFYPTKTLGALGDAGAVVTSHGDLAQAVRRLRSYGWSSWQGDAVSLGGNSRLDEIQAAVLRNRLADLPLRRVQLRDLGRRYRNQLSEAEGLGLPPLPQGKDEPPWHQFVVTYADRDRLRRALLDRGVETAVHYDPVPPRLTAFAQPGRFPAAEELASQVISLPFDHWLSDDHVDVVSAALVAAVGMAARSRM